jgi:hypothetical protein
MNRIRLMPVMLLLLTVCTALAGMAWRYENMTMVLCAWCQRTEHLNRHHLVPQHAAPWLADIPINLVILCRDCHFVLGHRCNWKKYNPDLLRMLHEFTNVADNVALDQPVEPERVELGRYLDLSRYLGGSGGDKP